MKTGRWCVCVRASRPSVPAHHAVTKACSAGSDVFRVQRGRKQRQQRAAVPCCCAQRCGPPHRPHDEGEPPRSGAALRAVPPSGSRHPRAVRVGRQHRGRAWPVLSRPAPQVPDDAQPATLGAAWQQPPGLHSGAAAESCCAQGSQACRQAVSDPRAAPPAHSKPE